MHFGLVAFNWLVKMYREELDNAGKPGWPAESSVKSDEEIAASILANNLFGIDIDLRAVQLSALSLYLRAKQTNKNAKLIESRLACADIAIFRGQHLKKITDDLKLPNNVTGQLFSKFCESVDEAAQMGSLVRLETHFRNIEAERLRAVIDDYVAKKAAQGQDESYFANETSKGLRLLDLMTRRYDVVFTNPPYMSNRNMNPTMSGFMKSNYKKSKGDLYSAFIERCAELLNEGGRMAMLTQQSFMFTSTFEGLRDLLLRNAAIENMVHTGPRAFAEVTGEKVNTTAYVLRREGIGHLGDKTVGIYFRLVKEPDAPQKQAAFEEASGKLGRGEPDSRVYQYRQGDFSAIPGCPWVYWITPSLRQLFVDLTKLKDLAQPRVGLQTGCNERFLRFWWEPGLSRLSRDSSSFSGSAQPQRAWFPYMKGGKFRRWYGNQEHCVNWKDEGAEIKACIPQSVVRNPEFYLKRGVTWTDLTSGKFSGRISPGGFIFDVSGSSIFPTDPEFVLGVMNSAVAQYALKLINPTAHVQVGDLGRLPMPTTSSGPLRSLVECAVSLAKMDSIESETTYDFACPPTWLGGDSTVAERRMELELTENNIDEEVYRLYQISDTDRKAIEDELSGVTTDIDEVETEEERDEEEPDDDDVDNGGESPTENTLAKQWVSYAVGIALGRFCPGVEGALGRSTFSEEIAQKLRLLSSAEGLMVFEKGNTDDLTQRVWEILRAAQGDNEAEKIVRLSAGLNGELRDSLEGYLLGSFFKDHVRQYRKRPIYWLLQSPKRTFSAYLFHERATVNTLSTLQGNRFVGGRLHRLETELADLLSRSARAEGRERANFAKRAREVAEAVEDLKAFDASLSAVNQFPIKDANGLPATVRWKPELDDGVQLNAAPLQELAPAWKSAGTDLKKAWKELEDAKYDWAKTAMRYWPGRVLKACKTNESFRIAHGLL